MHVLLGPVRCQGCGVSVVWGYATPYMSPSDLPIGLPGWFDHLDRRHTCPAGPRFPARLLRPWSASGEPLLIESMLSERVEAIA